MDGTVVNNAWKQELYDQIDGITETAWTAVPFNSSNFSALAPGVWTVVAGNQLAYAWQRNPGTKTVLLQVSVSNSTLSGGATSTLYINLPAGVPLPAGSLNAPLTYFAGAQLCGVVAIDYNVAYLRLLRDFFGTAWPVGGNLYVAFQVTYQHL
jgi:hypothetical protein